VSVDEHTIELAGSPVFFRRAAGAGVPAVYLHGIPTSSDDWRELLERTGGIAPDLIGFGRSGKGGHLDYTVEGLADAVEPLLGERIRLVAHDWGAAVGLELAVRHPARFESLTLCNPLPLIEGFQWSGPATLWRRPLIGELVMGATNRWLLSRTLRRGSANPQAWPDERIATVWKQFDQGTQRAILRLHRHADPHRLEAERQRLAGIHAPVLILWGDQDPWLPASLADRFAGLFANATLERVQQAGHWPWLDQPEVGNRITAFLEAP
jgi:pimeloyl-ACP methyl ester carboxylesterase